MDNLLFSIIIPVYRVEAYLDTCVESVRKQTYTNIEIILIDDGSPDSCPKMCDEYAKLDPRIRVIHQQNGGQSSARKAGIKIAKGDYVCLVDSDDYVDITYIQRMAEAIQKHPVDMVCCGSYIAREKENIKKMLPNRAGYYSREDIEREIFPQLIQTVNASYFTPTLWAKAIRKEVYEEQQIKLNNALKIGEDGACMIPCVYHSNSLYIVPECLYYYRDNDTSITKNKKAFDWDGPKLIEEHLTKELDLSLFDFREQMYRKTVHELFTVVASQFNRKESYRVITKDIRLHLADPVYRRAIKHCRFEGKFGKIAHILLQYRLLWIVKIINKIRS